MENKDTVMELRAEKLVYGGAALTHLPDGKAAMLWNALPGEKVSVLPAKKRRGVYELWPKEILVASEHRQQPNEEHFGSCSPWQIMDYAYENEQKVAIAREAFQRIGKFDWPELAIYAPEQRFEYRNKIEFSFYIDDQTEELNLAFFHRGTKQLRPIDGCNLATPGINEAAKRILQWVRDQKIQKRNVKSLIVRSNRAGQVIAALLLKDKLTFDSLPELDEPLIGFQLVYSTHKSPASVFTEILQQQGTMELTEEVASVQFSYGIESFFQVYIAVFEQALQAIARHVPTGKPLLDFYSGVGSIGLPLASHVPLVALIESNQAAVQAAERNIAANAIANATAHCSPAEKIVELIDSEHTLVVDPPRAGLHQKVVDRILHEKPADVIYLSCNVSTQARDLELLSVGYEITYLQLFNFFPGTPHIESLAVLRHK